MMTKLFSVMHGNRDNLLKRVNLLNVDERMINYCFVDVIYDDIIAASGEPKSLGKVLKTIT